MNYNQSDIKTQVKWIILIVEKIMEDFRKEVTLHLVWMSYLQKYELGFNLQVKGVGSKSCGPNLGDDSDKEKLDDYFSKITVRVVGRTESEPATSSQELPT